MLLWFSLSILTAKRSGLCCFSLCLLIVMPFAESLKIGQ